MTSLVPSSPSNSNSALQKLLREAESEALALKLFKPTDEHVKSSYKNSNGKGRIASQRATSTPKFKPSPSKRVNSSKISVSNSNKKLEMLIEEIVNHFGTTEIERLMYQNQMQLQTIQKLEKQVKEYELSSRKHDTSNVTQEIENLQLDVQVKNETIRDLEERNELLQIQLNEARAVKPKQVEDITLLEVKRRYAESQVSIQKLTRENERYKEELAKTHTSLYDEHRNNDSASLCSQVSQSSASTAVQRVNGKALSHQISNSAPNDATETYVKRYDDVSKSGDSEHTMNTDPPDLFSSKPDSPTKTLDDQFSTDILNIVQPSSHQNEEATCINRSTSDASRHILTTAVDQSSSHGMEINIAQQLGSYSKTLKDQSADENYISHRPNKLPPTPMVKVEHVRPRRRAPTLPI